MADSNSAMNSALLQSGVISNGCFQFLNEVSPRGVKRLYGADREYVMQEYWNQYVYLQKSIEQGEEDVTKLDQSIREVQRALEKRRKEQARLMESFSAKERKSRECKDEKTSQTLSRELRKLHEQLQSAEADRNMKDMQVVQQESSLQGVRAKLETDKEDVKAKEEQLRNHINLVVRDFMVGACAYYNVAIESDLARIGKADSETILVPITVGVCTDISCFNRALLYSKELPGTSTKDILTQVTGEDKQKVSHFLYRRAQDADEKNQEALYSVLTELKQHKGWSSAGRSAENREKQSAERKAAEAERQRLAELEKLKGKEQLKLAYYNLNRKVGETKDQTLVILRDPQFQMCTVATAGGAITFSAVGGTFGLASGVVVGSAVGVVPALFTLGLSIPVGGAIGGVGGLCTGTLVGGTSGGVTGFSIYKYRIQIKDNVMTVKLRVDDMVKTANTKANKALEDANQAVTSRVCKFQADVTAIANKGKANSVLALNHVKAKASNAYEFATTTKVGVTSTSAAAGAVVGGTGGGACGTVVGAVVGIPAAIFTFGLSIPACAVVGMCAGTTIGGSAGAVGGGLVGYTGFTHGKAISNGVKSSVNTVSTKAENLKSTTISKAENLKSATISKAENLKFKTIAKASQAGETVKYIVRGSTGETTSNTSD